MKCNAVIFKLSGTLPWRHRRRESASQNNTLGRNTSGPNGHLTDGDDEILESLVKTATKGPRTAPRERKRTRHADRKSCKQIFYQFYILMKQKMSIIICLTRRCLCLTMLADQTQVSIMTKIMQYVSIVTFFRRAMFIIGVIQTTDKY